MLYMRHIPHQVLNAKKHQLEANIVAEAGKSTMGTVFVCSDDKAYTDKLSASRHQQKLIKDAEDKAKGSDRSLVGQ